MPRPKDIVTLDFESYYAIGYSLRSQKLSMTQYIRDARFKAHGAAVRLPRWRKSRWISHSKLAAFFKTVDWKHVALLCHNTAFDALVLQHHYGHVPAYYLDTLSMSRGWFGVFVDHDLDALAKRLGRRGKQGGILDKTKGIRDLPPELEQELAGYGCQDADETYDCFRDMEQFFPEFELDIIDTTIRAYADPVLRVDEAEASRVLEKEKRIRAELIAKAGVDEKVLASNQQFAELLRSRGVEPPMKPSPSNPEENETFAFAKNDLDFQALADDPMVGDLIQARMAVRSTIGITRAERLLSHGVPGPLPIGLNYALAHTQRWTGGDKMNPQNFTRIDPKAPPDEPALRKAIIPPNGYKIVVVDSSQIEDRTNCTMAGQWDIVDSYRAGEDNYSKLASRIYNRLINKHDDPLERFVGKVARLGLGYQMGSSKFQITLATGAMGPPVQISDDVASAAVRTYRRENKQIVAQWAFFQRMLLKMTDPACYVQYGPITFLHEMVLGPNGLCLHYPGLRGSWNPYRQEFSDFTYETNKGRTKIYGGLFVENVIQWLARIIVAEQAMQIAKRYRVVLLVHDEVVYLAKIREAQAAYEFGLKAFQTPPVWLPDIPVTGEGGVFDCYMKP